jgi:hypothetical protein
MATSTFFVNPENKRPFKLLINGRYLFDEDTDVITTDKINMTIEKNTILTVDKISTDGEIITLRWIEIKGSPQFKKYYIEATKECNWINKLKNFLH